MVDQIGYFRHRGRMVEYHPLTQYGTFIDEMFVTSATDDYMAAQQLSVFPKAYSFLWASSQCVEKLMKAIILYNGGTINRSHDALTIWKSASKYDLSMSQTTVKKITQLFGILSKHGTPNARYRQSDYSINVAETRYLLHRAFFALTRNLVCLSHGSPVEGKTWKELLDSDLEFNPRTVDLSKYASIPKLQDCARLDNPYHPKGIETVHNFGQGISAYPSSGSLSQITSACVKVGSAIKNGYKTPFATPYADVLSMACDRGVFDDRETARIRGEYVNKYRKLRNSPPPTPAPAREEQTESSRDDSGVISLMLRDGPAKIFANEFAPHWRFEKLGVECSIINYGGDTLLIQGVFPTDIFRKPPPIVPVLYAIFKYCKRHRIRLLVDQEAAWQPYRKILPEYLKRKKFVVDGEMFSRDFR